MLCVPTGRTIYRITVLKIDASGSTDARKVLEFVAEFKQRLHLCDRRQKPLAGSRLRRSVSLALSTYD